MAKPYKPKSKRRPTRKVVPAPQPSAPKRDWATILVQSLISASATIIAALIGKLL